MNLRTFLAQAPRGTGAAIARALRVHPVMVSQWAAGVKRVTEDHAPALEALTEHLVSCEETCPDARWVRVDADGWPKGKPLLDKTPELAELPPAANDQAPEPATAVQGA
jgi:DNA-binding transcriptional regulator YdaS (Cro superfamily)